MNADEQDKLQATLTILRQCQIEGAVEMLDEMASNRVRATNAGHYLALLEEDANFQFDSYNDHAKSPAALDEKIEVIDYALGALKVCREIRALGVEPDFGPQAV